MVRATQAATAASASYSFSLGLPDASLAAHTGGAPASMTLGRAHDAVTGSSPDTKARSVIVGMDVICCCSINEGTVSQISYVSS